MDAAPIYIVTAIPVAALFARMFRRDHALHEPEPDEEDQHTQANS